MTHTIESTRSIAIIGSGAMGAGIAQIAAVAGHPVMLFDVKPKAAANAIAEIHKALRRLVEKGRMSASAMEAASARLTAASDLNELADATLVVEAIVENLDVKRKLFVDLEGVVREDCILATNTSSISITSIGAALRLPQRLLGMHFFNPAPLMALVEVVSGLTTDRAVAQTIYDTAAAWGKSPVHAKSTPGFIVNRVARPFYAEGLRLLSEQAGDAATIDAVMREAGGFRMGPFELMDLIGHDVNYSVTRSVFDAFYNDPRFAPSLIQQELVNAGFLGRKSGRGFYRHGDGTTVPPVQTEPPESFPEGVVVWPAGPTTQGVADRIGKASIQFATENAPHPDGRLLTVGDAAVYLTDGRSATQRAHDDHQPNTVLVDLALDYTKATRIALTRGDQCSAMAYQSAVGLFQAAGYAISRLDDVPGMAVMRTVAMLANEAADAVNQGVCDALAADVAMQKGVNYPQGPLAWADAIGLRHVMTVLDNLAHAYGEDRYRVSYLIRRKVWSGARFHE